MVKAVAVRDQVSARGSTDRGGNGHGNLCSLQYGESGTDCDRLSRSHENPCKHARHRRGHFDRGLVVSISSRTSSACTASPSACTT